MKRLEAMVADAAPRMRDISNYLHWNDAQRASEVIEQVFYPGGPVCLVPIFPDGRLGHTAIKATYAVQPYWVAEVK